MAKTSEVKIFIDPVISTIGPVPQIRKEKFLPYPRIEFANPKESTDKQYHICWADPKYKVRCGMMETGFFWDACHIDTVGLYANCSLNTPQARKEIQEFKAPKSARDIILDGKLPQSKYRQPSEETRWEGVVLASQNPGDRSIHRGSSSEDYWRFVEDACRCYGKHLFIKLHPWNKNQIEARLRTIASKYGSLCERVGHSLLSHCKFVLVYNSTFVADCLLRGVPVAQYAPGYFWQVDPVQYTEYELPDEVPSNPEAGFKFCDFLVWRYLLKINMPVAKWAETFIHFAQSKKLFPVYDEIAYATNL